MANQSIKKEFESSITKEFELKVIDNGKETIINSSYFINKINFFGEIISVTELNSRITSNIPVYLNKYDTNNYTLLIYFMIFDVRDQLKTVESIQDYIFKRNYINNKEYYSILIKTIKLISEFYNQTFESGIDTTDNNDLFNRIAIHFLYAKYDFIRKILLRYVGFKYHFEKANSITLYTTVLDTIKFIYKLIYYDDNIIFLKYFVKNVLKFNFDYQKIIRICYDNIYYFLTEDNQIIINNSEINQIYYDIILANLNKKYIFNSETNPEISKLLNFLNLNGLLFNK